MAHQHHNHEHHHHQHQHHHHHHGEGGNDGRSVSKINEDAFDDLAPTLEATPWIAKLGEQTTKELQDNVKWINVPESGSEDTKLLDYACGTGVVALALAPYYGQTLGVDISAGMLKQFDRLVEVAGYSKDKVRAVRGDLIDPDATHSPELSEPAFFNFDLVTLGYALHHVEDPENMLRKLAERTRPGGSVLVIDLLGEDRSDLPPAEYVSHGGFTEEMTRGYFQKVGLVDFGWKLFSEASDMPPTGPSGKKQVFMARGVKPSSSQL